MRPVRRTGVLSLISAGIIAWALVMSGEAVAVESPNRPSSGELVEMPGAYDGRVVTFEGEAIGEAMVRGDHAWIHLNDDAYMNENVEEGAQLGGYNSGMPVWLSADDASTIKVFGDYQHAGDIVRVVGTFNAACAEHGGDMDIHGTSIEHVLLGRDVDDPIHPRKVALAAVLVALALGVWWAEGRASRRERAGVSSRR